MSDEVVKKITLGSGRVYHTKFTGEIPEDNVIETKANQLGYISGGASVEYKPKYYTAKDDLGVVTKTIITEEEAKFKTGILTFNGNTLKTICETARVDESATKRTVKIGGVGQANGENHLIRFVHEDKTDGDVRITICGRNEGGFTLKYEKEKATVIDAEITCQSLDNEGTLIIYEETIPSDTTSNV